MKSNGALRRRWSSTSRTPAPLPLLDDEPEDKPTAVELDAAVLPVEDIQTRMRTLRRRLAQRLAEDYKHRED